LTRVLLLGGTSEARALAARLHPEVDVISSLAGRVPDPALPVGEVRIRGFGGVGQLFGLLTKGIDERGINAGVDEGTVGARGVGRVASALHSGQVQTYLGAVALGMLALLLLYAWLK